MYRRGPQQEIKPYENYRPVENSKDNHLVTFFLCVLRALRGKR